MLEKNKEIILAGEEALEALKEIEFILISLHKIGSFYTDKPGAVEEYRRITTDFIDNCEITKRLARVRTIISHHFDDSIGDDDMDDMERHLLGLKFWKPAPTEKTHSNTGKFSFLDGVIDQLTAKRDELLMVFTDQQEQTFLITFHNLISFHRLSSTGSEVCDMHEEKTSTLSQENVCIDPNEAITTYCFKSGSGETVLAIIASGYSVERI
ncbi:hypothetical protein SAMN04490190_2246 [Pseudomonas libanensis]|uniref:Uncharacterized protein n=1 Tax=Pseudomonas libanensis TaxID=75588 RepID=A0A0R2YCT7_9PSED|nr:hypothetical protein [Pseudomonas libanensis]KRP43963.1 hypothetical protein TU73_18430 [Pseudomonas libanensis]SDK90443.1 hypothetical protein SAMN04490190_2246 [Pseudomonas libanensis]